MIIGLATGIFAVLSWAAGSVFTQSGIQIGLTPFDLAVLRYMPAALLGLPLALHARGRAAKRLSWGKAITLTIAAGPLFMGVMSAAYVYAPLSHGAVLQPASLTISAMIGAALFLQERLTAPRLIGAGIVLVGLVWVASGSSGGVTLAQSWKGDILLILAGFMWAVFTLLLKQWAVDGTHAAVKIALLSTLVMLPCLLVTGTIARLSALQTFSLAQLVIVQGIFAGLLSVVAFGQTVQHLGAAKAAMFPALMPVATLLIGIIATSQIPTFHEAAGAVVALIGLLIAVGAVKLK